MLLKFIDHTMDGHSDIFDTSWFRAVMLLVTLILLALFGYGRTHKVLYEPTWPSLDSRPVPTWYDQAKVGIFLHWGLFSVPSWCGTKESSARFWWYWKLKKLKRYEDFMSSNYPCGFTYADFAPQFRAELYNAEQWADIFKAAGAK